MQCKIRPDETGVMLKLKPGERDRRQTGLPQKNTQSITGKTEGVLKSTTTNQSNCLRRGRRRRND